MNWSLVVSPHAVISILVCIVFAFWMQVIDAAPGARAGSDVDYVLWTGWIAFAMMTLVGLYAFRKWIHRIGMSPETRRPVPVARLEATESKLNAVRRDIRRGVLTEKKEIESIVKRIIREEKVGKVVKAEVVSKPQSPGGYVIEVRPTEPLGRVAKWMHAHIWFGLGSGVMVFYHGGGAMVSPLGILMNVLTAVVIVTGIFGTILWMLGPTWLANKEKDMSFEEKYVLDSSLTSKIKDLMQQLPEEGSIRGEVGSLAKRPFDSGHGGASGSALDTCQAGVAEASQAVAVAKKAMAASGEDDVAAKKAVTEAETSQKKVTSDVGVVQDLCVLIGQRARIRAGLDELQRIKSIMNIWRVVHIPASVLLLGIVLVHIISVWWY